jgi:hypothetical protein
MSYYGDIAPGDTLDFKFNTADKDGIGASLVSGSLTCYKDNSVTQDNDGLTLTADFDSVTGLNNVRVNTSADGTFYSAGSNYQIVLTAGTVDGVSVVGYVVGEFSIRARAVAVASIANNAVTAASLASDAVTEIQSGLATSSALATVDSNVDAILVDTSTTLVGQINNLNDISEAEVTSAVMDEVIEGSYTFKQLIRGMVAALLGKASGLDSTTAKFRNTDDDVDVITATVDANGNRTAVTLNLDDTP